jgi:D-alanyl-D-alanine carboxypeptidase
MFFLQKNKRLVFLIFLLTAVCVGSFFYVFSIKKIPMETDVAKIVLYPKYIGEKNNSPELNVAGAFSLYFNKKEATVLYEKNSDIPFPIASISKLMTALVVFENYKTDEEMNVSEYDVVSRSEFRDFRAWKETKIGEMLYPMLIESNNSAAFAFALISNRFLEPEEDAIAGFVKEMNKEADRIGLKKTSFINPSGLDGKNQYNISTAKEIALLARYILNNKKEIFEITKKPTFRLYSPDGLIYYDILSTNEFLHSKKNEWQKKIVGGKTGWTNAAYGCLLIVLESEEKEGYIVNVILGAEDRFLEMEKLINYVFQNYQF